MKAAFPASAGLMPASLVDVLFARAEEAGSRAAYTFLHDGETEQETLSFARLGERCRNLGAAIGERARPGDRALLLFPPGLEFVVGFLGCLSAGVVAVPAYPPRQARSLWRLKAILEDSRARLILTTSEIARALAAMAGELPELGRLAVLASDGELPAAPPGWQPPPLGPDSLAFLQYTSGSTALPKGVMVSHGNLLHNEEMIRRAFAQSPESVIVGWLPLYHDMGLIGNVLQPLYLGARCVLMSPLAFLQRPRRWLEAITRYRATTSGGPNFAYELCARKVADRAGDGGLDGLDLSSWSLAFNGAEPVRADSLERFASVFAPVGFRRQAFYSCYGLAEATLFVTGGDAAAAPTLSGLDAGALEIHVVRPAASAEGARQLVGCGWAWNEGRVLIVDPESRTPCPPDRVGEIWVGGPSVAGGYWGQPELSREAFEARLAGSGEGPFLRTGDLGFLHQGELYVTGRLKDLIILRGRNFYPQDIELLAETTHAALRSGCSAAFAVEGDGEERLVVVCELDRRRQNELSVEGLAEIAAGIREAIAEGLEIQPLAIVLAEQGAVPKTSSGKLQRRETKRRFLAGELPILAIDRVGPAEEPPARVAEAAGGDGAPDGLPAPLHRMLAELSGLPAERIEARRGLSALGFDSLSTVELRHRLQSELGVELELEALLAGPTVAELAELVAAAPAASDTGPRPGTPALGQLAELSHNQRSLWFLQKLEPTSGAYNIAVALRLPGFVDPALLRGGLQRLADRHDQLRTRFVETSEGPRAETLPQREIGFELREAGGWELERLRDELAAEAARPFDLEADPLLRLVVFRRSSSEQAALLVVHHIVADLWSLGVLYRELGTSAPSQPAPSRPALAYADFARWQLERLAGPVGRRLEDFWRRELVTETTGELPVLDFTADHPRPSHQSFRGASRLLRLPPAPSAALEALAARLDATLFVTLLALFETLLARYTRQREILVGVPAAGREQAATAQLVGYFVNPLVLRARFDGRPSFASLVARQREAVRAALAHQEMPFARLVERLQPRRDPSRSPLFQAMFVLQRLELPGGGNLGALALGEEGARARLAGIEVETLRLPARSAQFDLELMAAEQHTGQSAGLSFSLIYAADLFDEVTIARALNALATLAAEVVSAPERPIELLPLLSPSEREQLSGEWRRRFAPEAALDFLHELESRGREREQAIAAACEGELLSYGELQGRVLALAGALHADGLRPEEPVAVYGERGIDFLVAFLGILRAGGAYLPLDVKHPAERSRRMVEAARCRRVLAETRSAAVFASLPEVELWPLEPVTRQHAVPSRLPIPPEGDALAYVIFTSGSTGAPKGAMVTHRGMGNHLAAKVIDLAFTADDVMAQTASPCFDISVWQFLIAPATGARVEIFPDALSSDPRLLLDGVAATGVTVLETVPSFLRALLDEQTGDGLRLRWMIPTGEALPPDLAGQWLARYPGVPLVNAYGPTECSDDVTHHVLASDPDGARVPIGKPVLNTRIYVLDRALEPVPVHLPAEIFVGGLGVGRGYLHDPRRTAETFVPDPLSGEPGARLYRTGDLARWRPGGTLDFLGRVDFQVKVRGARIELGEIEATLRGAPGVRDAAVLLVGTGASARLVAYVVPEAGASLTSASLTGPALRAYLTELLPDAMVPGAYVVLESLPLTSNGKLDRKALPAPVDDDVLADNGAPPRTPSEQIVAGIWAEVLERERVGVAQSFFELGGHSLLATRVVSRLRAALGVDLPLRTFFEQATVAGLAAWIDERRRVESDLEPLTRLEPPRPEISFSQQRLWLLDAMTPGNAAYNMPAAVDLEGPLAPQRLAAALRALVARHDALRTVFPEDAGLPRAVESGIGAALSVVDLSGLDPAAAARAAAALEGREARRPFDLARGPLLRTRLLRRGAERHTLLVTLHHIAGDGWSQAVIVRDLSRLYASDAALAPLPIRFADYARWQRAWLASPARGEQLAWWRERFPAPPPVLQLATDHARPRLWSDRGRRVHFRLEPALAGAARALARRLGATLYMVLLGAFEALLHRLSGQARLTVGTPVANRGRVETEGLVGFFVNTLVLQSDVSADPTFAALVGQARQETLGAYDHQELPFEQLVEAVSPERDLSRNPLFQAMFILQNAPLGELSLEGLSLAVREVENHTAKLDLTLSLEESGEALAGWLEHSTDLFEPATAERLIARYRRLLETATAEPERPVSRLALLPREEVLELLAQGDGGPVPDALLGAPALDAPAHELRGLHEPFERQAEAAPGEVALVCGHEVLSYGELAERARRLAGRLRAHGVGPETLVAVCASRRPELIVALLGTLMAGGAYVPIDPSYPRERQAFLLSDSDAPVLLCDASQRARLAELAANGRAGRVILTVGEEKIDEPSRRDDHGEPPLDGDNLAYLIYTSGSTGRPKAVAITHGNALALLAWAQAEHGASERRVMLVSTSVCFDLSVFEIFAPLSWGGRLELVDNALALTAPGFATREREAGVTLLNTVPSAARELLRLGALPASVETVNLAGEALPRGLVDELYATGTVRTVRNLYGPSEDTTYSTAATIPPAERAAPAIGRPLSGSRAYLLDRRGELAALGTVGEIALAGAGLARGYHGRPALTAERFVPDPFGGVAGARLYRTGDLGRYRLDGNLEFLGRADSQVKLRGFRIELGEIEAAMLAHPRVEAAVTRVIEHGDDDRRLVGYVVWRAAAAGHDDDPLPSLRAHLAARLPAPMVPSLLMPLERLPMTPNGKVDRKALPDPARAESPADFAAPSDPLAAALARLWAEILRVERVGLDDNFFALGGHSLLASQVVARARLLVGAELPLRALFEAPTLRAFAEHCARHRELSSGNHELLPAPAEIPRVARDEQTALSSAQERMWVMNRMTGGQPVFHLYQALRCRGPLVPRHLAAGLDAVVARHEILRTTFPTRRGKAWQRIAPASRVPMPVVDLSRLPAQRAEACSRELARRLVRRPFDLARGPLLRLAALRLEPEQTLLVLVLHHIAGDDHSIGLLVREIAERYEASAQGAEAAPARPALQQTDVLQYADFAAWQRAGLDEVLARQLPYWTRHLAGELPVLDLPTDHPRPPEPSYRGALVPLALGAELSRDIESLARAEGLTLYMTLLAGYARLLAESARQEEVIIGCAVANRGRAELAEAIGFFVNVLPVRIDLTRGETGRELLAHVREVLLGALDHQDVPFERLVETLRPKADRSRAALRQTAFAFQDQPTVRVELPGGVSAEAVPLDAGIARLDLMLYLWRGEHGLEGLWEYATDLFERPTVERLSQRFLAILGELATRPGQARRRAFTTTPEARSSARERVEPESSLPLRASAVGERRAP